MQQFQAAVQTAQINLGYTRVTAPISGRIGRSTVTRGALVTASQATALTTIQQMDRMYVDISQSSSEMLTLERDLKSGLLANGGAVVRLKLEDGSDYAEPGILQFADVTVDQSTGAVNLRAIFPNPQNTLLPGMYVRAVITKGVRKDAILAPQTGVTRDPRGLPTAMVVGAGDKAELRTLQTGQVVGDKWLVLSGLKAGDQLIVEGLQKVKSGDTVKPVPAGPAAARPRPAARKVAAAMSRFFIERPIFAWVLAIIIMLVGALSIAKLPIAQYPTIAPPAISIVTAYPGASAQTLQNSVTQVIEQQLKGLDGLLYFSSNSQSNGQVTITATFQAGTNPDIAQVQVQNKVQSAVVLLPQQVQQQGVVVAKTQSNFLMIVALADPTDHYTNNDIGDFMVSNLQDPLSRVNGVGNLQVFGSQHAMRIWMDPFKLTNFNLQPSDVAAALQAQNAQVAAGQIGSPPYKTGQQLNAIVTAQSRMQTAEQFRDIILKTQPDGSLVRMSDVARVELGSESYDNITRLNGHPAAGIAIQLAPGANALKTADAVKARAQSLVGQFPPGIKLSFPVDNTTFVKISIQGVIITLLEAMVLVIVVIFVFLQNWRATLIPAIAIPVVLLGTFGVLAAFGYSINTLTMFSMVLVIGLLVDDAIVVVENVERVMTQEKLSPKEATRKSMDEITGALIGIALVLAAVLTPMAFFGGSTGVIYRQFSVTMVSAIILSILVALVLTPALCATLLKPHPEHHVAKGPFGWFNRNFDRSVNRYERGLGGIVKRPWADAGLLRRHRRGDDRHVRPPADRLPAGRRPGHPDHPDYPADRRLAAAHSRCRPSGRAPLSGRREEERERPFHGRRLQFRRPGPKRRHRLRQAEEDWSLRKGKAPTALPASPSGPAPVLSRNRATRPDSRPWSSRPCPELESIHRL